jgi:hypothetical protein
MPVPLAGMKNCQEGSKPSVSPDATDKWGDGYDDQERKIVVHKPRAAERSYRALDYRKRTGGRWQRCSRCHREHELSAPVLYQLDARSGTPAPQVSLSPIMVGQDLMGFVCSDCFHSTLRHIASIFPDEMGFPHVDADGMLVPTPRCECGAPLHYDTDGKTLLCSQGGNHWEASRG